MSDARKIFCPDCGETVEPVSVSHCISNAMHRREFLKQSGKVAAVVAAAPLLKAVSSFATHKPREAADIFVKRLRDSLTDKQKKAILLPWDDPRRLKVDNNWYAVPQTISDFFSKEQQMLIQEILKGVTSEEGYVKIMKAMQDDMNGFGNYSACLFSDDREKLTFMLTGRHQTIRADSEAEKNTVFGGPIFYGHAVTFHEKPDHPGNVWWHQARLASKVYYALDGKQQQRALVLGDSPPDHQSSIKLRGENEALSGISVSELSRDQKELIEDVVRSLLEPYRKADVEEVLAAIKANGGMDKLYLTFYKDGDLPDKDGIWDRWRLEGPSRVWYFRGSPHVHCWINIKHKVSNQ